MYFLGGFLSAISILIVIFLFLFFCVRIPSRDPFRQRGPDRPGRDEEAEEGQGAGQGRTRQGRRINRECDTNFSVPPKITRQDDLLGKKNNFLNLILMFSGSINLFNVKQGNLGVQRNDLFKPMPEKYC